MKTEYFNIVLLNIILLATLPVFIYGNVYNMYYSQASPISAETPKVILQQGTMGNTTVYTNNTSAKVSVAAPRNWWNISYSYRRQITITNNIASTLSSGYSVLLTTDTSSLVSSGKMLSNGNDLRIVYWDGTQNIELDRVNGTAFNSANAKIWFKTPREISAGGFDSNYFVYYGFSGALDPPNNGSNVYVWWDSFSTNSLAKYNLSKWVDIHGNATEYVAPTYDATNQRVSFDTGDNYASDMYLIGVNEADALIQVKFWADLSYPTDATVALVSRLNNPGTSSTHYYFHFSHGSYTSPGGSYNSWTNGERNTLMYNPGSNTYWSFNSVNTLTYAAYGTSHKLWWNEEPDATPLASGTHSGITDAGRWGWAPAQVRGWVDDILIRKYVEPEPSVSVGSEESYSYYPNEYNVLKGTYVSGSIPTSVEVVDSGYFVVENPPLTTPTWWDSKYDYRRKVTVTEPNKLARNYEPLEVYLTFAQGSCFSRDSIRVAYWNGSTWTEIPSQVYNVTLWEDTTVKSATILWNVDVELNVSKDYYVYYDEDGEVTAPSYTGLSTPSVVNRGTTFNLATSYGTGDTIKITGTYYGTERNVTWINLKIKPSTVAWDDWYISPGIFHLWINGSDVFEGGSYAGEANTGPVCEHSDGSNYAHKGNASSVTFEIVGPLFIRINVVYPSQNPGYGGTISGTFTDVFSIYYTPDSLTTRIKVDHKQEFPTAFTEATWGDWAHLDFPAWDVTPTQTNLAYRTSAGTYTEVLTPNATGGTQHSDWAERWVEIFDNVTVEPALGLFFMADDRYTINTANYRVMNVGGQGSIWGIHWFPYWSVGSSVSGTYNYEFWWVAKKTNGTDPIRDEYIKAVNSLTTSIGSETTSPHKTSTEFIFSGMTTNSPTQLNFTVVSHYNVSNVNVTIHVWNYSSSAYVTSGEGYLTYTSTGANVTKALNITTNPQFYTSSGYVKIKVTGVSSTTAQFQQKVNQIKLAYKYGVSTYDYVLKVVNQVADNWAVNLKGYNSSNIGRLLSLNISLHDGTTSDQIIVSGGAITQAEGPLYDLVGNATIYISVNNLQATTSQTSYLYIYLKILVPGTSTYNLFVITFEIT